MIYNYKQFEKSKIDLILKNVPRTYRVVEVGCGYGDKLLFLNKLGFNNITGVEINTSLVKSCKQRGLNVYSPDEFKNRKDSFDMLVLSHIIEHFDYRDLKEFLEFYSSYIVESGLILITTPTLHHTFYSNYDHVKPYNPDTVLSAFVNDNSQLQFNSELKLSLVNLYFRKSPFSLVNYREKYLKLKNYKISILNRLLNFLYIITGGIIGFTSGWIGLFKKEKYE